MKVVYFVQDPRGSEVCMGVVRSSRLQRRLQELQSGNPMELKLLGVIPTRKANTLRRELRATYADAHVRGGWFRPVPALMSFIRGRAVLP